MAMNITQFDFAGTLLLLILQLVVLWRVMCAACRWLFLVIGFVVHVALHAAFMPFCHWQIDDLPAVDGPGDQAESGRHFQRLDIRLMQAIS